MASSEPASNLGGWLDLLSILGASLMFCLGKVKGLSKWLDQRSQRLRFWIDISVIVICGVLCTIWICFGQPFRLFDDANVGATISFAALVIPAITGTIFLVSLVWRVTAERPLSLLREFCVKLLTWIAQALMPRGKCAWQRTTISHSFKAIRWLARHNWDVAWLMPPLCADIVGLAGILVAIDVNMNPTMGMNALMVGVVVVLVGGMGSIPGVVLGALFLASAQHLGVWVIGSQWQDAIAFVILVAFLFIKPEGFMGKRIRKAMA